MSRLFLKDPEFYEEVVSLADELVDIAKADDKSDVEDKVTAAIAEFLDNALPFDLVISGPLGELAEAADGPAIKTALDRFVHALRVLVKADPEKKAMRKARRLARRAAKAAS